MMHLKRMVTKKMAALAVAVGVALGGGGAAFAYFTSVGAGTGNAATAAASTLTISQVGPGYDSLVANNQYTQDQCFECAGQITQFGNEINLAAKGQLSDVIVAFRNWGSAVTNLPITLTLYSPGASSGSVGAQIGYASVTNKVNVPASGGSNPTTFNVTFDFHSQQLTLDGPVVYGISYSPSAAPSLNVALSSSAHNLTIGSDVYKGYVFLEAPVVNALSASNDAGSCATSAANTFAAVSIWCPTPPINYGAYGSAQGADIPAVEFNVVGGAPVLYPGETPQSIQYAITNPGTSPVYVDTVTAALTSSGDDTVNPNSSVNTGCETSWYSLANVSQTVHKEISTGVTFFRVSDQEGLPGHTVMSIAMIDEPFPENACEGTTAGLTFSSN